MSAFYKTLIVYDLLLDLFGQVLLRIAVSGKPSCFLSLVCSPFIVSCNGEVVCLKGETFNIGKLLHISTRVRPEFSLFVFCLSLAKTNVLN